MTKLIERRSRLKFETSDAVRSKGKLREISVEARPGYAVFRLKGTRRTLTLSWEGLFVAAAKAEANRVRAEKRAAKKGGKV